MIPNETDFAAEMMLKKSMCCVTDFSARMQIKDAAREIVVCMVGNVMILGVKPSSFEMEPKSTHSVITENGLI